jgi:Tfp pilus assembly protein PilF
MGLKGTGIAPSRTTIRHSGIIPTTRLPSASRGLAYQEKKQPDRAIRDFDQAVRLDPNDATAFAYRAGVYLRTGALDRAISDYDQAVRLGPDNA